MGDSAVVVRPIADDTRIWPAGYMWTSANDMSRALFALMHNGRVDGKQAIPASVVTRVMTPHAPMPNVLPMHTTASNWPRPSPTPNYRATTTEFC